MVVKRFSPASFRFIGMQVNGVGSSRKHFLKINPKPNVKLPTQRNLRVNWLPVKGRQGLGTPALLLLLHNFTAVPHRSSVYKCLVSINLELSPFVCLANTRQGGLGDRERWCPAKSHHFPQIVSSQVKLCTDMNLWKEIGVKTTNFYYGQILQNVRPKTFSVLKQRAVCFVTRREERKKEK